MVAVGCCLDFPKHAYGVARFVHPERSMPSPEPSQVAIKALPVQPMTVKVATTPASLERYDKKATQLSTIGLLTQSTLIL